MNVDIHYKYAVERDIPQLVNLMNKYYKRNFNKQYFIWQYFNSGYPSILSCAFHNEKLVGMFGMQKKEINLGLNVCQAIDMLIDADFRGRGIFLEISQRATNYFEEKDILCVLPNKAGMAAVEKTLNWKSIGKIDCFQLKADKKIIDNISPINLKLFHNNKSIRFIYNQSLLNWRFKNNTLNKYYKIDLKYNLYSYVKLFKNPETDIIFGDIVFFYFDTLTEFNELLIESIRYLCYQNADIINVWSSDVINYVLTGLGFERVNQERYFCIKELKNINKKFQNINNWHLMMSDSEML